MDYLDCLFAVAGAYFLFSLLGWAMETAYCSAARRHFSNNAVLSVPFSPVYGAGAVLSGALTESLSDPFAVFGVCALVCCAVEYFTGTLLEKTLLKRYWDYSKKTANFKGRICLKNGVLFGLLGLFAHGVWKTVITVLASFPAPLLILAETVLAVWLIFRFRQVTVQAKDLRDSGRFR